MSETSENPVQNKVITETLQRLAADIEAEINGKVSKAGDNITGSMQFAGANARIMFLGSAANPSILAGGKRIANVAAPQVATDAANKNYVDTQDALNEKFANKVTAISSASTDTEYPSAKAVYTAIQNALVVDTEEAIP
jgi:hypothetical protein